MIKLSGTLCWHKNMILPCWGEWRQSRCWVVCRVSPIILIHYMLPTILIHYMSSTILIHYVAHYRLLGEPGNCVSWYPAASSWWPMRQVKLVWDMVAPPPPPQCALSRLHILHNISCLVSISPTMFDGSTSNSIFTQWYQGFQNTISTCYKWTFCHLSH